jgi:hypothetical protein
MASELSISANVLTDVASVFSITDISEYKGNPTALYYLADTISYAEGSMSAADAEKSRQSAAKREIGSQAEDGRPGLQFQTLLQAFRYFVGDPEPYDGEPLTDLGSQDEMKRTRAALEDLSQKSENVEEAIRLTKHELDKLTVPCMAAGVGFTEQDSYYPWIRRSIGLFASCCTGTNWPALRNFLTSLASTMPCQV